MSSIRSIVLALSGLAAGIALALACNGESSTADAADGGSCDCPPAEPPLEGRIVKVSNSFEIAENSAGSLSVSCHPGSLDGKEGMLLAGSCSLQSFSSEAFLNYAGILPQEGGENTWSCRWTNESDDPNTMIATAVCLVLPGQD